MDLTGSFQLEHLKSEWDTLRKKEDDLFFGSCLRLFEEEILCDVTLVIGDQKEKIRAHKFILIARSEVFCAMLSGNYSETSGEIEIPDIEPDIFKILLRYMYTGHFEEPTEKNIFSLLYAGEKYQLLSFVNRCEIYLKKIVSVHNYFTILNHATLYNKKELLKECRLFAAGWGNYIVVSKDFISLTRESLREFVNSDYNRANEVDVFKACIKWAKNQCEMKRKKITRKNIRQILGKILQSIRFTAMSIETFTADVSEENILTDEEKVALFQSIVNKSKACKKFNFTSARCRRASQIFQCLSSIGVKAPVFTDGKNNQEFIKINFDKDVHLFGVYVLKPENGNETPPKNIQVTIKEFDTGKLHSSHDSVDTSVKYADTAWCYVPTTPFVGLSANTYYLLIITVKGGNMVWKKGNGKDDCFQHGDLKMNVMKMNLEKVPNGMATVQGRFRNALSAFYGLTFIKDCPSKKVSWF